MGQEACPLAAAAPLEGGPDQAAVGPLCVWGGGESREWASEGNKVDSVIASNQARG